MSLRFGAPFLMGVLVLFSTIDARADDGAAAERPKAQAASERLHGLGASGQVVLRDALGAGTSSTPLVVNEAFVFGAPTLTTAWISFTSASIRTAEGSSTTSTTFGLAPSLDVFVARNVSLGASGAISISRFRPPSGEAMHLYSASISPRVGYLLPLTQDLGVWPRVRVGVTKYEQSGDASGVSSEPAWTGGVSLPLVVSLTRHALLEVGPDVTYVRSEASQGTVLQTVNASARAGLSIAF